MTDEPQIAVWSDEYVEFAKTCAPGRGIRELHVWENEDGEEVLCTAVVSDLDSYKWPDKKSLGPVTKWLRNVSI